MENKNINLIRENLGCWQEEKKERRSVIMITVEQDDNGKNSLICFIDGKKSLLVSSVAEAMCVCKELQEIIKIAPMYSLIDKFSRVINASKVDDEEKAEQKKED